MIRIAVLEDDNSDRNNILSVIERYKTEKGTDIEVTCFKDGLDLVYNWRSSFDIVFLDIEVPMVNGIEAARKIRMKDDEVILVFLTNLKQYALKGYEVNALDFLVKPISYIAFSTLMDRAGKIIRSRDHEAVVLKIGTDVYRVDIKDIYYVEVLQHRIVYHTSIGDIDFFGNLKEEEKKLPEDLFVRCNAGFLVNLSHVRKVEGDYVYLGKEKIKISRGKKTSFMNSLLMYMNRRY